MRRRAEDVKYVRLREIVDLEASENSAVGPTGLTPGGGIMEFLKKLTRTKYVDLSVLTETKLARCLSTLDLTALGVGSTLGAGIYVVAGQVAREVAGPAVILSFLIAAIASVFAGLCYAEFGARVPKTGSAYIYSYVTVGELWAFIIGWNLILEYVIGTASVARAWSNYFDSLIGFKISHFFNSTMHMEVPSLSAYPDFFAFSIVILLTLVLCIGVKESSILNNIFTALNLLVVMYVIICGMFKINIKNWSIPADKVPASTDPDYQNGSGGFFPFGVGGMLSGAATCFYAFVGFDVIATTGEEVRNPQKAIPIGIICSLLLCFLAYFGVSSILTLMVPYYSLDHNAPIPQVFEAVGWHVAKYVVAIGAVAGLSTSLLGGMFPMPRIIYAMAEDGLLFRFLAWVPERFKTPIAATLVSGLLAGCMAMLFDLKELVDMMSIGTLLAYTLVAASVLLLRYKKEPFRGGTYQPPEEDNISINLSKLDTSSIIDQSESTKLVAGGEQSLVGRLFRPIDQNVSEGSQKITTVVVSIEGFLIIILCLILVFLEKQIIAATWWALLLLCSVTLSVLFCVIIILRQPENRDFITFKVPCVAVVSSLSMFVNIYLMMKLGKATWIRFGVWLAIGLIIYFSYGIWHSSEGNRQETKTEPEQEPAEPPQPETPPRTENTALVYQGT